MARFRERWAGCEITYLWTIGRMAKYLGQPEPKPNPGDFIRDDDEKGNETAKSKIKKIESLTKEQRKKMTREEIMRRHDERFIGKTFGQVTSWGMFTPMAIIVSISVIVRDAAGTSCITPSTFPRLDRADAAGVEAGRKRSKNSSRWNVNYLFSRN